jgi:hypothetical protein
VERLANAAGAPARGLAAVRRNDDVIAELRAGGFGYRRLTFSWRRAAAVFLASVWAAVVVFALHWLT